MIEMLGILLVVQGVGGFVNRIAESGSKSWFIQLHALPPGLHLPVSAAMAVLGAALVLTEMARKRSRRNQPGSACGGALCDRAAAVNSVKSN
jgi:hypothetical protein